MVVIRIEDCRRLSYCSKGIRNFCKLKNIDYSTFLKEGLVITDDSELKKDYFVSKILEEKEKWEAQTK